MHLTDLGTPAASARPEPLFPAVAFATPWRRLQRLSLPPVTSCVVPAACADSEHALLLLAGQVEVETRAPDAALIAVLGPAPAWLVGQLGSQFTATSRGPNAALLVHLEVAADAPRLHSAAVGRFDVTALAWRPAIHGGRGQVATRHVLPSSRFSSALTFLDHARLGPDSSLGLHYHDALEESFVMLGGHGYLTAGTRTHAVGPGGVVFLPIRTPHGLYCPGPEPLEFVRVAVAVPGERYTTVDLHDDLGARRPAEPPSRR